MWSEVLVYQRLGIGHIADLGAVDHIAFLLAMTVSYGWREWKAVAWLVTAFTVGHSLTLLLATLEILTVNDSLIESLIAVTIAVTALVNIFGRDPTGVYLARTSGHDWVKYGLVFVFGLIHGLGFSNFLRNVLGAEESLLVPLFSFNVGLEIGQLLIVSALMSIGTLVVKLPGARRRDWILVGSGAALGIALQMIVLRILG